MAPDFLWRVEGPGQPLMPCGEERRPLCKGASRFQCLHLGKQAVRSPQDALPTTRESQEIHLNT